MRTRFFGVFSMATLSAGTLLVAACGEPGEQSDRESTQVSKLAANATVEDAVNDSGCTELLVRGLANQLADEIMICLRPNSLTKIDNIPNTTLAKEVFPYLQTAAATALKNAITARGASMTINSGWRALPEQYLLSRWAGQGRCGISVAADPGQSNHETGLAIDIQDNGGWNSYLTNQGWVWLGSGDPVHFDFKGGGTVDFRSDSVLAFQRLWNRNHPADLIDEDGSYGPMTASRLQSSPVAGFPIGAAGCGKDAGSPVTPDAAVATDAGSVPTTTDDASTQTPATTDNDESSEFGGSSGCSTHATKRASTRGFGAAFLLLALALARRSRKK